MKPVSVLALVLSLIAGIQPSAIAAQRDIPQGSVSRLGIITRDAPIVLTQPDGEVIRGSVGRITPENFWIDRPTRTSVFVPYASYTFTFGRDANAGIIVGTSVPSPPAPKWLKPTLISLAVFAGVSVATHGLFPGCLFERCLR